MSSTLADTAIGCVVVVDRINTTGRRKARLLEVGLLPGVRVTVERLGPAGEPIQLRFRKRRVSLSREEAAQVEVRPEGS